MTVTLRRWRADDAPLVAEAAADEYTALIEAARLLTAWLFAATNIERVQATVEPSNVASQRVLEKVGFQREGLLRGYASWSGERRDVFLYGKLEGD